MEGKEMRKIVPRYYSDGYMSLKPNSTSGCYNKNGRFFSDVRALLNYVRNEMSNFEFDFSEIPSPLVRKLEDIVAGKDTVREEDWRISKNYQAKV